MRAANFTKEVIHVVHVTFVRRRTTLSVLFFDADDATSIATLNVLRPCSLSNMMNNKKPLENKDEGSAWIVLLQIVSGFIRMMIQTNHCLKQTLQLC